MHWGIFHFCENHLQNRSVQKIIETVFVIRSETNKSGIRLSSVQKRDEILFIFISQETDRMVPLV